MDLTKGDLNDLLQGLEPKVKFPQVKYDREGLVLSVVVNGNIASVLVCVLGFSSLSVLQLLLLPLFSSFILSVRVLSLMVCLLVFPVLSTS